MERWIVDDAGFGFDGARIAWADLRAVGVRTTSDGPFAEDVFWQLLLSNGRIEVPGSAVLDLERLMRNLPGLDAKKITVAMGSCRERVFRVWHCEESRDRLDEAALEERFSRVLLRLGARSPTHHMFTRVVRAWSRPERRYHDVEHLSDCLRALDAEPSVPSPVRDRVELALFYHDVVYEPGANDCEARSADLLLSDATELGVAPELARSAAALVLATAHAPRDESALFEQALIADIDLAILARDPLRLLEFDHGVEEEYAALPRRLFFEGRARFLTRLLEAPIYRTTSFHERLEERARENVRALLASPRYAAAHGRSWGPSWWP
jgi:predicted metal-dependent HD superfamily phosphohydrolase